ncbi:MAG: acyl-CoA desaturase [Nitrospiraceae bacterium]|nr:acyl-CoA desaturase [Nitrospiraceae bacterium]
MNKPPLIVTRALILFGTPLLAVTLVPYYGFHVGFGVFEWSMGVLFGIMTLHSISAGYHRLWSHKAYQAHAIVRLFYAICGACTIQNSILHWSSDHRNHHKFVDNQDRDPYAATRGFWFSHMGWMIRDYKSGKVDFSNVKDLVRDPIVMWQHKYYIELVLVTNVGLPLLLGYLFGSALGVFLLAGVLRLVVIHHFTFLINSLAHIWGSQPYSDTNSSRDSLVLALLTFGEGYHNYHHSFQGDYRNGIRWWHFDPTKWIITALAWVGLTSRLKRAPQLHIEKARLAMQYNHALRKAAHLQEADRWCQHLEERYAQFLVALEEWATFKREWYRSKKDELLATIERAELKQRYAELKRNVKFQRQEWHLLTSQLAAT